MTRDAAAAIQLPQEDPDRRGRRPDRVLLERPHPNRYLDCWVRCHYFFVRKVLLFKYSYAFVALPGGFGTLDELLEALTLIQTKKISSFPVVLVGTAYWRPVQDLISQLAAAGTIDPADLRLRLITDRVDDVVSHIERHAVRRFGLIAPSRLLGERATSRPAAA